MGFPSAPTAAENLKGFHTVNTKKPLGAVPPRELSLRAQTAVGQRCGGNRFTFFRLLLCSKPLAVWVFVFPLHPVQARFKKQACLDKYLNGSQHIVTIRLLS